MLNEFLRYGEDDPQASLPECVVWRLGIPGLDFVGKMKHEGGLPRTDQAVGQLQRGAINLVKEQQQQQMSNAGASFQGGSETEVIHDLRAQLLRYHHCHRLHVRIELLGAGKSTDNVLHQVADTCRYKQDKQQAIRQLSCPAAILVV